MVRNRVDEVLNVEITTSYKHLSIRI